MSDPPVVLASGSPQRRDILDRLGIAFEVRVSGAAELVEGDPEEIVVANALLKARAVIDPDRRELVIGCDTDVVIDGRIIGKPESGDAARRYLELLSGRSHQVVSGLAVLGPEPDRVRSGLARSEVTFRRLDTAAIGRYINFEEWRGRAGGYAIQGRGSALVAAVEGDIANVIGLPVGLLFELAPELEG